MEEMQVTCSQVRPWVRFWARMLDYTIMGFVLYIVLGVLALFLPVPFWLFGLVGLLTPLIWVPIEAWFIALWGATPGKALLKVRVGQEGKVHMPYGHAIHRAWSVWIRGVGLGLPIVMLVTMIVAYSKLTIHKVTTWDKKLDTQVKHRLIGAGPIVLYIIIVFAIHIALSSSYMLAVYSMLASGGM